jgi:hypothetical protein
MMVNGGIKMKNTIIALALMILVLPIMVSAQSSPTIRLSISNYDPMPVQPGQFVDVWVVVQNTGAGDARDLRIEYIESEYFKLVNSQDKVKEISVLGSYKDYVIKYKFQVSDNVVEGQNELRFQYTLGNQPNVVSTSNLKLDIKSTETPVTISSVRLTPDPVEPGKKSDLVLAVKNLAPSSNLRDVSVELQLMTIQQTGIIIDLPFSPVDSTNKKSISRILPGQTTEFRFSLVTYPDAESKIYKIPVTITYYDDVGRQYQDTTIISINVNSEPDLYIILEGTTLDTKTRTGDVIFDVINQGVSDIKLLSVKLQENDFEIISSANTEYLGNIDSDDFKSARFRVSLNEEVEELTFPLTLTYRDALNNEFTETIQVTHKLKAPESNGNSTGTIIVVIIILLLLGVWYYRRKQKRKKALKDEE